MSRVVVRVLLALVRCYRRAISPVMGARCRFEPSCAEYAEDAQRAHGPWRGSGLTAWRLLRCQPFARGGIDPVPNPRN